MQKLSNNNYENVQEVLSNLIKFSPKNPYEFLIKQFDRKLKTKLERETDHLKKRPQYYYIADDLLRFDVFVLFDSGNVGKTNEFYRKTIMESDCEINIVKHNIDLIVAENFEVIRSIASMSNDETINGIIERILIEMNGKYLKKYFYKGRSYEMVEEFLNNKLLLFLYQYSTLIFDSLVLFLCEICD
ncbi:hypothetical protein SNEBB_003795 [Seison nebaliae]|nr:hypothetical protein SNEBB_003795 [Seison nebaliae]